MKLSCATPDGDGDAQGKCGLGIGTADGEGWAVFGGERARGYAPRGVAEVMAGSDGALHIVGMQTRECDHSMNASQHEYMGGFMFTVARCVCGFHLYSSVMILLVRCHVPCKVVTAAPSARPL